MFCRSSESSAPRIPCEMARVSVQYASAYSRHRGYWEQCYSYIIESFYYGEFQSCQVLSQALLHREQWQLLQQGPWPIRVGEGRKCLYPSRYKNGGVYRSGDGGEEPTFVISDLSYV